MKKLALAVITAAFAAAPALSAQAVGTPAPQAQAQGQARGRMAGPGQRGGFLAQLNLTDAQKAQVKAIHEKYAAQYKSARDAAKPDFDAMRAAHQKGDTAAMNAARAKLRADMAPVQQVRQQEMAEVRAILTPAQQKQFDTMQAQMRDRMANGKGGMWRGRHGGEKPHTGADAK